MTGDAGGLEFDEILVELADTMWGVTARIGDPESAAEVAAAADYVHSIVTGAADVLSALSHWYESHAADLFDGGYGAEVDVVEDAHVAAADLRAFATRLREDAARSSVAIGPLRRFGRRALYKLEEDELEDEDEAWAVTEIDYAGADETDVTVYARLDVARYAARQIARRGTPGRVYRVVPLVAGERQEHVAEWPGEGDAVE